MVRFALKVGYPYGPQDQCCYDGNKKDRVLARPKAMLETKVQPLQGKSLQGGCNQRGGKRRGVRGDDSQSLHGTRPPV